MNSTIAGGVTTGQAASSPDVTNKSTCIGESEVQHCISLVGLCYLAEEINLSAFQEPPGLPTARCAIFPTDVQVVEVPQQYESLQSQCLL